MKAGVLALQGSSDPHMDRLRGLGVAPVAVRQAHHLDGLTHLVLPGGESTTLYHLMTLFGLWQPIEAAQRTGSLVVFGTCAGAILLGIGDGERPPRMGLLDTVVVRNAYGRQLDSFQAEVDVPALGAPFRGVFIRAPKLTQLGPGVETLGRLDGQPVLVAGPGVLAATFHPELTDDNRIHERFLAMQPTRAIPESQPRA